MSKKKPSIDVSPKGKDWQVKVHGNQNASKVFDTQKKAIDYGK